MPVPGTCTFAGWVEMLQDGNVMGRAASGRQGGRRRLLGKPSNRTRYQGDEPIRRRYQGQRSTARSRRRRPAEGDQVVIRSGISRNISLIDTPWERGYILEGWINP